MTRFGPSGRRNGKTRKKNPQGTAGKKKKAQVISPTACGALLVLAPRISRKTSWNPRGTLVEPSWNLTSGPPRTTPQPIWAETPKLSAVGEKRIKAMIAGAFCRRSPWIPSDPTDSFEMRLGLPGELHPAKSHLTAFCFSFFAETQEEDHVGGDPWSLSL